MPQIVKPAAGERRASDGVPVGKIECAEDSQSRPALQGTPNGRLNHAANPGKHALTREYALAALRSAALRAHLLANDLDVLTLAIRDGLVSPEAALMWARDLGVLDLVGSDDAAFDAMDALEPVP